MTRVRINRLHRAKERALFFCRECWTPVSRRLSCGGTTVKLSRDETFSMLSSIDFISSWFQSLGSWTEMSVSLTGLKMQPLLRSKWLWATPNLENGSSIIKQWQFWWNRLEVLIHGVNSETVQNATVKEYTETLHCWKHLWSYRWPRLRQLWRKSVAFCPITKASNNFHFHSYFLSFFIFPANISELFFSVPQL